MSFPITRDPHKQRKAQCTRKRIDARQETFPFPSLDFPDRTEVTVGEVAAKLDVTQDLILEHIDAGNLHAINLGAKGRGWWRIPVESYHAFILQRIPLAPKDNPLLTLETPALKRHVVDCLTRLAIRGEALNPWLRAVLEDLS